jgi:hypothetical protein
MYNSRVPIMYEINGESGTIRTKCFGQVTLPEVIDHFRTLGEDPNCPNRLDVYLDVSDVALVPESKQLSAVVTELKNTSASAEFSVVVPKRRRGWLTKRPKRQSPRPNMDETRFRAPQAPVLLDSPDAVGHLTSVR